MTSHITGLRLLDRRECTLALGRLQERQCGYGYFIGRNKIYLTCSYVSDLPALFNEASIYSGHFSENFDSFTNLSVEYSVCTRLTYQFRGFPILGITTMTTIMMRVTHTMKRMHTKCLFNERYLQTMVYRKHHDQCDAIFYKHSVDSRCL